MPGAGVAHLEGQLIAVGGNLERDLALRGELDRVAEQVQQHLAQVAAVEHHPRRHVLRDRHAQAQRLAPRRLRDT